MSRLDRNVLLRMLWDMNPTRWCSFELFLIVEDSITAVSRYMGSFPQNVDEIVSVYID